MLWSPVFSIIQQQREDGQCWEESEYQLCVKLKWKLFSGSKTVFSEVSAFKHGSVWIRISLHFLFIQFSCLLYHSLNKINFYKIFFGSFRMRNVLFILTIILLHFSCSSSLQDQVEVRCKLKQNFIFFSDRSQDEETHFWTIFSSDFLAIIPR